MSSNSAVDKELGVLKRKLDSAVSARQTVENDLKHQSSLLSEFIIKLSQVGKGIDKSLDNKLAKLRTLFSSSASLVDIEKLVKETSAQLNKFSQKNTNDIRELQNEFNNAGAALQKVNGLPDNLRRELRTLLKDNEDSKDSLAQYIPLLSQLVTFYQTALKSSASGSVSGGLLNQLQQPATKSTSEVTQAKSQEIIADKKVVKKFNEFLTKITVSRQYKPQILKIKSELNENMPNDRLLSSFLAAFDVISHDLQLERNTAKVFLSTLSDTLSTVQSAVKSTILSQEKCQQKHTELNEQLQGQITDMADGLDQANSLVDIKVDINSKLKAIATTLEEKTSFEVSQQKELEKKLVDMQEKVNKLERQGKTFEKRIQEQQAKSLQDALTKLYNRAAFDEHFAKEIVRCQHNNIPLAIVVADLDNFKRINDTYGHTAGDKTLQVIANTFTKQVQDKGFIARYGGEEFVLIFSDQSKESLVKRLNVMREKISQLPFKFKNNKVSITISVGVTHIKPDDNVHIAFERADEALYKAKEQGKNQVIYSD